MRKTTVKVNDYSTYSASADLTAIKLPREGLVTEIGVRFACTMNGSTLAAAVQPDGLRRGIQNLKIEGDGGKAFLGLSGEQAARILALWNLYDHRASFNTLLDAITEHFTWIFHPGSNPLDPFDMSAAIPASALSTFQSLLTCPAAAVVDDTQTISSGYYYYWVHEVLDVKTPAGLMVPQGSTLTYAHDSNYSDFSKEIDIPAGAFLRRIFILVQDETGTRPVRADDEVTGVRVSMARTGQNMMSARWEDLKADNAARFGVLGAQFQVADSATGHMGIPDGFAVIDFRKYADPIYGLDLRGYQTGDLKLGLTIENYTSGDDTLIYFDQLAPVDPVYVGR
jgi:hypothetical protein